VTATELLDEEARATHKSPISRVSSSFYEAQGGSDSLFG